MEIRLDLIQPSPHPIRSNWDEDKMQELTDSIKEQGLIVPIKVRPTDNEHFEIVYGHRRAEACRRAGLDSIEALIEGVDDTRALIQALIENVQREDMEPMDLAHSIKILQNKTGWSARELGRRGIIHERSATRFLALLTVPPEVQELVARADGGEVPEGKVTERHVREALTATRGETQGLTDSIRKAASEGLTARQTRRIAEAVAHAEDEAEREAILSTDPTDPLFDRLVQAKAHVHRSMEREQQRKREEDPREVRAFLDSVRAFRAVCQEAVAIAGYGKFSPEAKQFAIRQLDRLIADIESLKSQLEV